MSDQKLSRRTWLRKLALVAAAVGASPVLSTASTQSKASKPAVHYRDYPKQSEMCGMCKFFSGMMASGMMGTGMMGSGMMSGGMMGRGMMTGECQVVDGRISPMGWCDLYASRRS
jgi:hypothetical protein